MTTKNETQTVTVADCIAAIDGKLPKMTKTQTVTVADCIAAIDGKLPKMTKGTWRATYELELDSGEFSTVRVELSMDHMTDALRGQLYSRMAGSLPSWIQDRARSWVCRWVSRVDAD